MRVILPSTGDRNSTAQPKLDRCLSSTSHCSPSDCCLSVVLEFDKGDYSQSSHVVFCPNEYHSFEPFLCLDLGLECYQSLFQ